ncbi:MAG: glutamine-synthetase adenylyltransferase, partial [Hyphomonadaceae bacterium]
MLKLSPLADTAPLALEAAYEHAPYLKRLSDQRIECVETIRAKGADAAFAMALDLMKRAGENTSLDTAMPMLRHAKRGAHLAIAAADLSGAWSLAEVIGAMTRLADVAVSSALRVALKTRGLKSAGLFVTALGKMGAGELNYSSDIDLAAFYDPEVFDGGSRAPGDAASRVLKDVVRMLESRTPDGYVFRTDLRLRPDPRSTPLAVSTQMAETYYESIGQNWERMVWIKARACVGDLDVAEAFHKMMQPFVWRKHLDYWAIDDIHSIKRMINASKGDLSLLDPAADVKLGPGGIREIEFFVQTQQLILGGRNDALRDRKTLIALAALNESGIVDDPVAADLQAAYCALRNVEHRIQMIADEQTHTLPADASKRLHVARLCGYSSLDDFDMDLLALRRTVNGHYRDLFAGSEAADSESELAGNLVFTGVDDDPGTLETLSGLGFENPSRVIETIREWHRGNTPATRTQRGQQLLTALLPALLKSMAETGEPDTAFMRFADFFSHLKSGVQTLSMLQAEPDLLADL